MPFARLFKTDIRGYCFEDGRSIMEIEREIQQTLLTRGDDRTSLVRAVYVHFMLKHVGDFVVDRAGLIQDACKEDTLLCPLCPLSEGSCSDHAAGGVTFKQLHTAMETDLSEFLAQHTACLKERVESIVKATIASEKEEEDKERGSLESHTSLSPSWSLVDENSQQNSEDEGEENGPDEWSEVEVDDPVVPVASVSASVTEGGDHSDKDVNKVNETVTSPSPSAEATHSDDLKVMDLDEIEETDDTSHRSGPSTAAVNPQSDPNDIFQVGREIEAVTRAIFGDSPHFSEDRDEVAAQLTEEGRMRSPAMSKRLEELKSNMHFLRDRRRQLDSETIARASPAATAAPMTPEDITSTLRVDYSSMVARDVDGLIVQLVTRLGFNFHVVAELVLRYSIRNISSAVHCLCSEAKGTEVKHSPERMNARRSSEDTQILILYFRLTVLFDIPREAVLEAIAFSSTLFATVDIEGVLNFLALMGECSAGEVESILSRFKTLGVSDYAYRGTNTSYGKGGLVAKISEGAINNNSTEGLLSKLNKGPTSDEYCDNMIYSLADLEEGPSVESKTAPHSTAHPAATTPSADRVVPFGAVILAEDYISSSLMEEAAEGQGEKDVEMPGLNEVEFLSREFIVFYLKQCGVYDESSDENKSTRVLREELQAIVEAMCD
eukprot:gene24869-31258_t